MDAEGPGAGGEEASNASGSMPDASGGAGGAGAPFQLQATPELEAFMASMGVTLPQAAAALGMMGMIMPGAGGLPPMPGGVADPAAAMGGDRKGSGRGLGRKAAAGVAAATAAAAAAEGINNMAAPGMPPRPYPAGPTGLTAPAPTAPGTRGKSQYRGVSWCEKVKKWRALLWDGQKQVRWVPCIGCSRLPHACRTSCSWRMPTLGLLRTRCAHNPQPVNTLIFDQTHRPDPQPNPRPHIFLPCHVQRFLGHFTTDLDAARAYDRALVDLKGPDAKTNFPLSAMGYDGEEEREKRGSSSSFKVGLGVQGPVVRRLGYLAGCGGRLDTCRHIIRLLGAA